VSALRNPARLPEGSADRELSPAASVLPISVIVCAYSDERWGDLCEAVDSLRSQAPPPAEIIVVIDHNDELLDRVRSALPDVIAVANTGRRGLSGARNTGVVHATGSIIAFLDDDAVAEPQWLVKISGAYREAGVAGTGGAIVPNWVEERPPWFPEEFDWVVGCTYRGMPESTSRVRNPIGANMSFRADIFEAAGAFRSEIGRLGTRPLGCEETEFCIRAAQRLPGSVFVFEPEARVQHRVPASRATWSYFVARCYAEGLSKAVVAEFAGASDGLSTEWGYTLGTLPRGVARGFAAAARGDGAGLARAAAIVTGLVVTTSGYVVGRVSARRRRAAWGHENGSAAADRHGREAQPAETSD
jgi:GT2 family glycosyltransferase